MMIYNGRPKTLVCVGGVGEAAVMSRRRRALPTVCVCREREKVRPHTPVALPCFPFTDGEGAVCVGC